MLLVEGLRKIPPELTNSPEWYMIQNAKARFWVCQLAPSKNPKYMGNDYVICAFNHKEKYKKLR